MRQRVQALAVESDSELVRQQAVLLLALADGTLKLISRNPSFEDGSGEGAQGWSYWRKPDVPPEKPLGRMLRSRDVAHGGGYSLLCDAMLRGGPVQETALPGPGRYVAVAWVYAPAGQTSRGTVELTLTPLDEQGRNLPGYSSGTAPPPPGRWSLVTLIATVPEAVAGSKVARLRLVPIVDGFQAGGRVHLDEVGLYRLD